MTYKHYIIKNKLTDSPQAWREYNEKYHKLFKAMPEKMKKQQLNATYILRFTIQF